MTFLAYVAATVLTAADVACVESGRDWREVDAVLQVVRNRADSGNLTFLEVLGMPHQFAHGCPGKRRHWRHVWAAMRMMGDRLDVPDWLRDGRVRWFCARDAAWKWYERDHAEWSHRLEVVGALRHLFWRTRG